MRYEVDYKFKCPICGKVVSTTIVKRNDYFGVDYSVIVNDGCNHFINDTNLISHNMFSYMNELKYLKENADFLFGQLMYQKKKDKLKELGIQFD